MICYINYRIQLDGLYIADELLFDGSCLYEGDILIVRYHLKDNTQVKSTPLRPLYQFENQHILRYYPWKLLILELKLKSVVYLF